MYTKQERMMQMTFTKLPKAITAEEPLSTPLPPVKWIIPGLLPAGLALFAGPSKAGKSWLTLWLCLQISPARPPVPACGQRGYTGKADSADRMPEYRTRLGGTDYQLSLQPFKYRAGSH